MLDSFVNDKFVYLADARRLSFADEFPQEGVHGDDGRIYGFEGFQEFDQALGFCIVGAVLADGFQERFGIGLEDGQFVRQGRVEYGIGIFLIGVDIFFFATAHVTPDFHGRFGTAATELVVPDHTADDARIRCGNAVVVVDANLCQDAEGDFYFFITGQHIGQGIVQGMESFYDDGLARFEARRFFVEVALAFNEFKTGQMDVGSLTLAIKENLCEASKMAYFLSNFSSFS